MSSEAAGQQVPRRLGYLIKHAQLRLAELTGEALAPYGISGRELAVLLELSGSEAGSQQRAAQRLGVDRTTMVALIDALEEKGLVTRRPQARDRRRNIVELTAAGRDAVDRAGRAAAEAERRFLAPLSRAAGEQFKQALWALVAEPRA